MSLADPTLFNQGIIPPLPTGHPFILDPIYPKGTVRASFWSLTTSPLGLDYARAGYFGEYITPSNLEKGIYGDVAYQWCVRGGQSHDIVPYP